MALVERGPPVAALERLPRHVSPAESGFKYRRAKNTTLDRRQNLPRMAPAGLVG
jgi:hypothetical protein